MRFSKTLVQIAIIGVPRGGKSNLGSVLEGTKPWVHPTYGHAPEQTQSAHPFFKEAIDRHEAEVTRAVDGVLDKLESRL
jgi:hypothetical protein